MFERYTEKARRVIFFARYEASQGGAGDIDPGHLLLGITREDKSLLEQLLPKGNGSIDMMRSQIRARLAKGEMIPTSVELPLAPESKRVLHYAHEESDRLQAHHIGTEHLLLGLMREENSVAAEVLTEMGLQLTNVREALGPHGKLHSSRVAGALDVNGRVSISLGIENLIQNELAALKGARVGLVCNQASVDHSFRHVADLFHDHADINITALFGPQHGIR